MTDARTQLRGALKLMTAALAAQLAEATPLPGGLEDYAVTRADFVNRLGDAFLAYVSTTRGAADKNEARRALVADIPAAFLRGYKDAGAEEVETSDSAWLAAQITTQLAWLDKTFADLKVVRQNDSAKATDLRNRAEVWGVTLDGIYAEGKLRGATNVMLTYDGDDGEESCAECQRYKGKRHSAKWWVKRDLVRRNGNEHYTCGRWKNCHHHFYLDDGTLYAE